MRAAAAVEALRRQGVRIALDDFGTGWASLSLLKRLSVDMIKIDRSFVAGLGRDREDAPIVSAVIGLAEALGPEAIAEGVETAEQLARSARRPPARRLLPPCPRDGRPARGRRVARAGAAWPSVRRRCTLAGVADVVMPRLSDSMEEGTIVRWLNDDGDEVSRGEELVEIETDKATMTYEADADGALEIVAAEGTTLAIGEVDRADRGARRRSSRAGAGAGAGGRAPERPGRGAARRADAAAEAARARGRLGRHRGGEPRPAVRARTATAASG